MDFSKRLFDLRSALDLSMDKFGSAIGITRSSVNSLEKGVNNPSEQTLKLICREFNVNYFWLTQGEGDMFVEIPNTVIDELAALYDMSDFEIMMINKYLKLSKQEREITQSVFKKLFSIE